MQPFLYTGIMGIYLSFVISNKRHMALLPFFGFTAKNSNVADATHPASAPIANAGKTAPAPGADAVAVFLDAGCR